ncbi:hypothetical protein Droror1_Dr00001949 [Drosera rotundifolia]
MAMCVYSINFSQSPSSPSSFPLLALFKDLSIIVQARRIVSRQSYGITGFKSLSWMCRRRHVKPLNLGSLCSVQGHSTCFGRPVSTFSYVSFCTQIVNGYWVGPDVEDGWGFVEASIESIS